MKYFYSTHLEILKSASGSDCTNGGLSSRYQYANLLIPADMPGLLEPIKVLGTASYLEDFAITDNTFLLKRRVIFGLPHYSAYPYKEAESGMFGGHFITYCGNGFNTITGYPIPLHDRYE